MAVERRGKIVAMWTMAVGVVVMIAAGIGGKDWIREEWCSQIIHPTPR